MFCLSLCVFYAENEMIFVFVCCRDSNKQHNWLAWWKVFFLWNVSSICSDIKGTFRFYVLGAISACFCLWGKFSLILFFQKFIFDVFYFILFFYPVNSGSNSFWRVAKELVRLRLQFSECLWGRSFKFRCDIRLHV